MTPDDILQFALIICIPTINKLHVGGLIRTIHILSEIKISPHRSGSQNQGASRIFLAFGEPLAPKFVFPYVLKQKVWLQCAGQVKCFLYGLKVEVTSRGLALKLVLIRLPANLIS